MKNNEADTKQFLINPSATCRPKFKTSRRQNWPEIKFYFDKTKPHFPPDVRHEQHVMPKMAARRQTVFVQRQRAPVYVFSHQRQAGEQRGRRRDCVIEQLPAVKIRISWVDGVGRGREVGLQAKGPGWYTPMAGYYMDS